MKASKTISILSILILWAVLPAYGQKEKNTVFKISVGDFIYNSPEGENSTAGKVLKSVADILLTGNSSKQQPQYADAVRASIITGLSRIVRFRTVDGDFLPDELAEGEPAFCVDGVIANISTVTKTETTTNSKKEKITNTYYRGLVSVTVNLKNPVTGTIDNSQTFNLSESDASWMGSEEKAMSNTLEWLTNRVASCYNRLFPLHASIIEGGEVKKEKKMKTAYIDLGAADGAYEGQLFNVYTVKTIAGKEARTEIGRLRIEELQGDDISLCKVTKGSEQVKEALDKGQTLVVISR